MRARTSVFVITLFLDLFPRASFATTGEAVQQNLDLIWIMVASAMVFFMQAGFTALETGLVRAKNSINVSIKNISDLMFSVAGFWFVGFGLMFGATAEGWLGISSFMLSGHTDPFSYTFFVFQAVFAGTAVTIVSGAMAERVRFGAYLIAAATIGGLIYPVFGHWAWGGAFLAGESGWLASKGFVDFAGSTVVHSVGGWVGLAGALVLGPRIGRFNGKGEPQDIPGHNIGLSTVGVLILWFGWFGFNGGSTLVGNGSMAKVILNTLLAGALGGITTFFLSLTIDKSPVVEEILNGILAGLVGITAGCAVVEPAGAVWVGITSGILVYFVGRFLLHVLKVDDPVSAVPVHGFCGAWGTISLALFAPAEALPAGGHLAQLWIQFVGATSCFAWAFSTGLVLFLALKAFGALRVSPDDEIKGLNISEHGARMIWLDTMDTVRDIVQTGDLSRRVEIEIGTEMGEVAISFNRLLDELQQAAGVASQVAEGQLDPDFQPKSNKDVLGTSIHRMIENLSEVIQRFQLTVETMSESVEQLETSSGDLSEANRRLSTSLDNVSTGVAETTEATRIMRDRACNGSEAIQDAMRSMADMAQSLQRLVRVIHVLDENSRNIGSIVTTIEELADQTNLLALNAAIEAARAGESGKGFAVVADEVRRLAEKSLGAAKEVSGIVGEIESGTTQAVAAAQESETSTSRILEQSQGAVGSLDDIRNAVERVAEMMETITVAVDEQSVAGSRNDESVNNISGVAHKLMDDAEALARALGFFRTRQATTDSALEQAV